MFTSIRSRLILTVLGAALAQLAIGCSGSDSENDSLLTSKLAVQKRGDGAATGNGKTCSWYGTGWATSVPVGTYGGTAPSGGTCTRHPDGSTICSDERGRPEPDTETPPPPVPGDEAVPPAEPDHQIGDWFPSPDGCNRCTCTEIGIMCTVQMCAPPVPPPRPGCDIGGDHYAKGARFPSPDGCNSCSCTADGQIACTEMACFADPPTQK
jgi:hypothetical protein